MDMTTSSSGWSLQLPGSSDPETSEEVMHYCRIRDIYRHETKDIWRM